MATAVLSGPEAAKASESLTYRCSLGNQFAFVNTIPEEGRALLEDINGRTELTPDGRGGYFNDGAGVSFRTDTPRPQLWLGDVAHTCEIAIADSSGGQPVAGSAAGGNQASLNVQGQSLGGKLRGGPGTNFQQIGSLSEGSPVTIIANAGARFNGYDWFEVTTNNGQRGYQWGGIMCSFAVQIPGIYQQCGGGGAPAGQIAGSPEPLNYQGRSLGGKLRIGPGMNYPQSGSLAEGTWVTILRNAGGRFNGYDWFEVVTDSGIKGFQWGGVMCSNGTLLPGIYQQCGN